MSMNVPGNSFCPGEAQGDNCIGFGKLMGIEIIEGMPRLLK